MYEPEPGAKREVRRGLFVALVLVGGLFGWAAFAPLDATGAAIGEVRAAGRNQPIQTTEGGRVEAIYVAEGAHVRAGQPLLRLDVTETQAATEMAATQLVALAAQRARIQADLAATDLPASQAWAPPGAPAEAVAAAAVRASAELRSSRAQDSARASLAQEARRSADLQLASLRSQLAALTGEIASLDQELAGSRELAAKGFTAQARVRTLERSAAELSAQMAVLQGRIAQVDSDGRRALIEYQATRAADRRQLAEQLAAVELTLRQAAPRWAAAAKRRDDGLIVAPIDGVINGLVVHRPQEVVSAGKTLMEIVPRAGGYVIEAKVTPDLAPQLRAGQSAEVRFLTSLARDAKPVDARVARLSADAFHTETGTPFYAATLLLSREGLATIARDGDLRRAMRAGAPVQVSLRLRQRTALEYLIDPLRQAFRGAMHET